MSPATAQTRELAVRENDGISVRLIWHPSENAVSVAVEDVRAGRRFELAVERDKALEAFHHPFAYAG